VIARRPIAILFAVAALASCGRAGDKGGPAAKDVAQPGWKRPPIIDFHAHLSLDGAERVRQIADTNGIELFVNLSGGSARHGTQAWQISQMLSRELPGRVVHFVNPNWRDFGAPGWAEREAAALETAVLQFGFAGLKISKGLGLGHTDENDRLVAVDDRRLDPLWAKAGALGVPVCIHVADPRAFWWPLTERNERWDELGVHPYWAYGPVPAAVLSRFPDEIQQLVLRRPKVPSWPALLQAAERMYRNHPKTIFVAVHFGNAAEDLDYVDGLLDRNPNVWIDTAARVGEFGRHPAARLRAFFDKWQDRIVFGTDIGVGGDHLMLGSNGEIEPELKDVEPFYRGHWRFFETSERAIPHPSPIQGRWTIDAIGLSPAVLDKIYRANALNLLDRGGVRARTASFAPSTAPIPPPADPTPAWAAPSPP